MNYHYYISISSGILYGVSFWIGYFNGCRTETKRHKFRFDWTCSEVRCKMRIQANDEDIHGVMVSTHILNHSAKR